MASQHVRVPNPVYETAKSIRDEKDFPSIGEAIRHMCRTGGHDV